MKTIQFIGGVILFTILSLLINSCSPKIQSNAPTKKATIFYPEDSEDAKIQYLVSFGSSQNVERNISKFQASIVGRKLNRYISKPYGVFIREGKIYTVAITSGTITILDFKNQKFDLINPQGRGRIKLGLNVFVDSLEQLYVADAEAGHIKYYNSNTEYLGNFGSKENLKPTDVFIKNSKIYVCDNDKKRINIYDEKTHKFLDYFPKVEPRSEGWLYSPTNLFVSDESIFISEIGGNRISVFDHDGNFIKTIGSIGVRPGQFSRPKGVAVDKEENLYVVDGAFQNVQIFDKEGRVLLFFGGAESQVGVGGMNMPTTVYIDYDNNKYFEKYVDPSKKLLYIILVANQYGPDKINVYGRVEPK